MGAAKHSNGRSSNSQFNVIPLKIISFAFVVLVGLTSCFDSSTEDTPPPVEALASIQDPQTSEGQTLYGVNCAGCHGADGSTINGNTPDAITAAMNNIGTMNGISLTTAEIQSISDFLTGNTAGGTDSGDGTPDGQALYAVNCADCHGADGSTLTDRTGPQIAAAMVNVSTMTGVTLSGTEILAIADFLSGTSDGQVLYEANCSGCHGADGSTLAGRTGAQIAAAIVNVSTMMGVSLSGAEILAIADFLSGSTGTGGPPANHTNSEDGVLHAPGNTLPYSSGCTVCHGATLEGGVGPSCFACHAETWNESAPTSGGGTGGGGSTTSGQALYTTYCAACHGATGTSLSGRTVDQVSAAIGSVTTMNNIALSLTELQAIADYLSVNTGGGGGGDTGSGTGGDGSGTVDGQALYTANCSVCHGADAATINDKSASGITAAMTSIGSMTGISLSAVEIQSISDYLAGITGGGTGGGNTGGGSLPPNHTNSEEGVLHADGNDAPYTNGCTSCHGITLEGGSGPSCFTCHGVEWNESPPSGGGTSGGGGTIDGQALFSANCAGCHGISGSGINDKTASGITVAISNIVSMNNVSVTATEIQAISDFLTGTTGGSTGGTTGGGGTVDGQALFTANCSACHGATGSNINGTSVSAISAAINNIASMSNVSVTATEIQAISDFLIGSSGGSTGGGTSGGGGTVDGQALFTANCSACHGATGSGINDKTASGITTAMSNIGSMGNVSVTATEIQAISVFLTGSTGGGTSGGGGTVDGQALFTANCSACHGATGSGINGTSVSAISAAISNIASMSNVSVTATETQAISDFLTGSSGGSSGGGSGGLPTNHTNAEDGVLHAPGNNYPYSNGCTACHGVSLQGGVGPSCFACHSKEWNESAPSGGGSTGGGTSGTTTGGQALFSTYCSACHGASGSNINGRTTNAISTAIANIGSMNSISLTTTEIQAIADYLSGSTGGGDSGSSGGTGGLPASHTNTEEGVPHAQGNDYPYTNGCTSCHGSTLRGAIGPSCYSCHGQEWRENGSGSSGGSSSGTPAGHTNSEGGVLHAPGNDNPFTNGCTSCHGSTLQGGIGPSCYSCHGQEWQESSSGSSSHDGGDHGEEND